MIEREECEGLSVRDQCGILGLCRSSLYYEPVPVSREDKVMMDLIDEIYTDKSFYGARKISLKLKELGVPVGRYRTGSLMRLMGLEAVFPRGKGSNLSLTATCRFCYGQANFERNFQGVFSSR